MPNWCSNKLYIYGENLENFKKTVRGFPAEYAKSEVELRISGSKKPEEVQLAEFSFHAVVPIPDDILAAGYSQSGYNWQIGHWGTKWDVGEFNLVEPSSMELIYHFDTAWSPPVEWVKKASAQMPQYIFSLAFHEESDAFAGKLKFQNGELIFQQECQDNREMRDFKKEEFGIEEEEEDE